MRLVCVCAAALLGSTVATAAPAAAPIDAKTLSKDQFKALPDTAVLLIRGKTYSVAELRALEARHATLRAAGLPSLRQKAKSDVTAAQAAFRADEKSRIARLNAGLSAQFSAVHRTATKVDPKAVVGVLPPQISSVHGEVEPGATVYVEGKDFGGTSEAGRVLLKGLPGGERSLAFDPAYLFPWQPTGIAVVVPDVSGVLDQNVSIVVVRKGGSASAPKTVPFKAAREISSAFPIKVESCGKDATDNACLAYDFFEGVHYEDTFWEEDSADCDQFHGTAKLPWTFEKFQISNESHEGQIGNPSPVRSGDLYRWQVCWTVNGAGPNSNNHASYVGYILIKGPKGVPSS
jgi:hypothetical protein